MSTKEPSQTGAASVFARLRGRALSLLEGLSLDSPENRALTIAWTKRAGLWPLDSRCSGPTHLFAPKVVALSGRRPKRRRRVVLPWEDQDAA